MKSPKRPQVQAPDEPPPGPLEWMEDSPPPAVLPEIVLPEGLVELAMSFPTVGNYLLRKDILSPTIEDLIRWRRKACHGEELAALFLLNVWSPGGPEMDWPKFDVMDALGTWDAAHRLAFAVWAQKPWWC